jgi:hypothetical protein
MGELTSAKIAAAPGQKRSSKAFQAGCDAYASKLFSPRALLTKIREYVPA